MTGQLRLVLLMTLLLMFFFFFGYVSRKFLKKMRNTSCPYDECKLFKKLQIIRWEILKSFGNKKGKYKVFLRTIIIKQYDKLVI